MTTADRLHAWSSMGIDVYIGPDDALRVRLSRSMPEGVGPKLVQAVLPSIRRHQRAIRRYLYDERRAAVEELTSARAEDVERDGKNSR
jgi:hypothetical protein